MRCFSSVLALLKQSSLINDWRRLIESSRFVRHDEYVDELKTDASLRELQQYVEELEAERGFADNTVLQKCLLLGEEIGELFKAVRKDHGSMPYDAGATYHADAAGEIADVLLLLTAIANRLDVDIETAVRNKEAVNRSRIWT